MGFVLYNNSVKIKKEIRKNINRSGSYPCVICKETNILCEHHILGREIPNPNHPSNIVSLCSNCHRLVHEGEIIIEKWIMSTGGLELMWHKKGEESFSGQDSSPYIIPK